MQKQTTYLQLQPEDRITIATMRQRGFGVRHCPYSETSAIDHHWRVGSQH